MKSVNGENTKRQLSLTSGLLVVSERAILIEITRLVLSCIRMWMFAGLGEGLIRKIQEGEVKFLDSRGEPANSVRFASPPPPSVGQPVSRLARANKQISRLLKMSSAMRARGRTLFDLRFREDHQRTNLHHCDV